MNGPKRYAIKSKDNGTYFTGNLVPGVPRFGGRTPEVARLFTDKMEAVRCASMWPLTVLFEVVEVAS